MKYKSTRGGINPISFTEAVMMGLASDGGLIVPEKFPDVGDQLDELSLLTYPELAMTIISLFVGDDIPEKDLKSMIDISYSTFDHDDIIPIQSVGDLHIMELFHGPTLAFKDVALQFLGNLFEYILKRNNSTLNILGATSGDTGSAAISGVRGKGNMNIFILHPHQRVSRVQERQMTTVLDENVFNIAIQGTFDDGQRIIKALFNDLEFKKEYCLGAINSVNWARIVAQIVYYFYGALKLRSGSSSGKVQLCVPTGNFGNIFAGYAATCMGAPISKLILATNENNILARFFESGIYEKSQVKQTLSPSMDIQIASNFERYLYYLLGENAQKLNDYMYDFDKNGTIDIRSKIDKKGVTTFVAKSGSDKHTLEMIKKYYEHYNYLLDPHTAIGVGIAEQFLEDGERTLCLATAHPAKFGEAIKQALGNDVAIHDSISALTHLPTRCTILSADKHTIQSYLIESIASHNPNTKSDLRAHK